MVAVPVMLLRRCLIDGASIVRPTVMAHASAERKPPRHEVAWSRNQGSPKPSGIRVEGSRSTPAAARMREGPLEPLRRHFDFRTAMILPETAAAASSRMRR